MIPEPLLELLFQKASNYVSQPGHPPTLSTHSFMQSLKVWYLAERMLFQIEQLPSCVTVIVRMKRLTMASVLPSIHHLVISPRLMASRQESVNWNHSPSRPWPPIPPPLEALTRCPRPPPPTANMPPSDSALALRKKEWQRPAASSTSINVPPIPNMPNWDCELFPLPATQLWHGDDDRNQPGPALNSIGSLYEHVEAACERL